MDPILTSRLRLAPLTVDDLDPLHYLTGDAALMRHITGRACTREETAERLALDVRLHREHGFGLCLAYLQGDDTAIGRAGIIPHPADGVLDGELAWLIATPWQGRGLATEAAQALIAFGRDTLRLRRIFALANPANLASIRVMEKLGMVEAGTVGGDVRYDLG